MSVVFDTGILVSALALRGDEALLSLKRHAEVRILALPDYPEIA